MLKSSRENCWAAAPGGISRTRLCHSANQYHGIFLVRFCNARRMKTLNSINVTKIDAVSAAHSIVHTISANHPFMSPRITVKKKIDFWIMALWDNLTSSGDFYIGGFFWVLNLFFFLHTASSAVFCDQIQIGPGQRRAAHCSKAVWEENCFCRKVDFCNIHIPNRPHNIQLNYSSYVLQVLIEVVKNYLMKAKLNAFMEGLRVQISEWQNSFDLWYEPSLFSSSLLSYQQNTRWRANCGP